MIVPFRKPKKYITIFGDGGMNERLQIMMTDENGITARAEDHTEELPWEWLKKYRYEITDEPT